MDKKLCRIGNHDLAYLTGGEGRPILCLNGIGMPAEVAENLAPYLIGQGLGCLSPEWRGSWPRLVGSWPSLKRMSAALAALLDALEIDSLPVLGHSWGGTLAQEFARRHPDRVSHLILASTTAGAFMVPGKLEAVADFFSPGLYKAGPGRNARREKIRRMPAVDPRLATWQLSAANRWTSIHWLHRLNMPTLIIAGKRDSLVRPVNARILAARLPDAQLEWVEGGSHMCLYTRADALIPRIADFVS